MKNRIIIVALVAVGLLGGCKTLCPKCPPKQFIEVDVPVPVPCPTVAATPLPDLPIFHLTPNATPEEIAMAYHETAVRLMGEVLKLNALLDVYRPNALTRQPDATP